MRDLEHNFWTASPIELGLGVIIMGATEPVDILVRPFRLSMSAETTARTDALTQIEAPLGLWGQVTRVGRRWNS
eukprot:4633632-Amphidinium_carterae.1